MVVKVTEIENMFKSLIAEIQALREENSILTKEVQTLKERLNKYENPKGSNNSSVPPSQDPFRKTKSLRKKSTQNPGGQKGHKGKKLKMVAVADAIIIHDVKQCSGCHLSQSESLKEDSDCGVIYSPTFPLLVLVHQQVFCSL